MFKPEGFSNEIFKSRYAFTEAETWEEACDRVARQMSLAELPDKQKIYFEKFKTILVDNLFVPGGRIWYNSGRTNPQLLNCFSGDTRFITSEGIFSLEEKVGSTVKIRNKDGEWEEAEVREFGEQRIYTMSLANDVLIKTTAGHEWLQKDGSRKTSLEAEEVLFSQSSPIEKDINGIRHGLVYGDGHVVGDFSQLILCGEKKQELHKWFEFSSRESIGFNGSRRTYYSITDQATGKVIHRQPKQYKELPNIRALTPEYARGFIAGLIATDGCVPEYGSVILNCEGLAKAKQIAEIAILGGCIVNSVHVNSRVSPFDGSARELATILIKPFTAPLIRTDQLGRTSKRKLRKFRMEVKVLSVVDTGKNEKVFCVVAKRTRSFTLANGILTGNCFVLGSNLDSKEGWGQLAKDMIVTSMTGGGCGVDFSDVRPRGASIGDQKGECPGPVELMKLINGCASPIRAGGARRVALMFSLDLDHPDVDEFLDAKLTKGELTYANVSVRSKRTSEFIKAVKQDKEWELSWKGKYKKTINAKYLWNKIVKNAYESAEPGFLNWELVENENTIAYSAELVSTNPCGEIPLSPFDCCCLGHIVLPRFVEQEEMNFSKLGETIRIGVRLLDNVLTVNSFPLPEMKQTSNKLRRIGMGTTGLADTLAMLGYKYGEEQANKFIDKLYRFISKAAYEASVMLAVEKGMFPACDPKRHVESGYVKRLPAKIKSLIAEHGIRNCAVLTAAPTGTVSILSGNCSSGIEPMFAPAYERRYWDKEERKTELVFHPLFAQFMRESKDVSHFVSARDLSIKEHLEVQSIIQKHICNAVSKTINIKENVSIEEMSALWLEYLPYLKGTTFYRENTRGFIDDKGNIHEPPLTALSLEEAIAKFNVLDNHVLDSVVNDCPSGICEIK